MKYLKYKDKNKRVIFAQVELKYTFLKAILRNAKLPLKITYYSKDLLDLNMHNKSFIRIKNRCLFSNRSKSIYRKFGLSRIKFRELASYGLLVGVRKSSW